MCKEVLKHPLMQFVNTFTFISDLIKTKITITNTNLFLQYVPKHTGILY